MTTSNKTAMRSAFGPLVVSRANPRYFTIKSGDAANRKAIYLTGSHIWNNFHDGMGPGNDCADSSEQFDYAAYLKFLKHRGHNFIRLWRWEQFKSQAAGGGYHLCMAPQPWQRTGPGTAKDGKPMFDLETFDQAYFDRLRQRVIAAGNEGIYVDVMFFDGWAIHLSPAPDNVEGHPFFAANNINGIGITSILDYQVLPLEPRVQRLQQAYIQKVIDTIQDLPNVLYEVANESSGGGQVDRIFSEALGLNDIPEWGDSTAWQYWVIDTVKEYEQQMGYDKHPIGITMQFPVADQLKVNDPLFNSRADWISPGYDDEIFASGQHPMAPGSPPSRWLANPPANDGRKVVISDTDHYSAQSDVLWAWKSFLRGHNPILMDYGLIGGINPPPSENLGPFQFEAWEPVRYAMGDTLRYAERMKLIDMTPHGELSSTGYVLANPGEEYLILQPNESGDPLSMRLEAGTYTVEWFSVNTRETQETERKTVSGNESIIFTTPFKQAGPVVLYLKQAEDTKKL